MTHDNWMRFRLSGKRLGLCLMVLFVGSCGHGGNETPKPPQPPVTTEPTRADLIQAVRNHVNGKTYNKTVTTYENRAHTCTQYDVDTDPYMPRNPELAKCPYVGKTYWRQETVTATQTQNCPSLPDDESSWSVTSVGNETWRVAFAGSVWDVHKVDGRAVSGEDAVRVSTFAFTIKAHQDC